MKKKSSGPYRLPYQRDPISPYIFVLCAEILSHNIGDFGDIKGKEVYCTGVVMSLMKLLISKRKLRRQYKE